MVLTLPPAPPRRALFLANPKARRAAEAEGAADLLREGGLAFTRLDRPPRQNVTAALREAAPGHDAIIIAGGDGSVNRALAGAMATGLPLGIIPLGTANDFARTLGISGVDAAVAVILAGHRRRVDVGEANGHPFLNAAIIGIGADVARALRKRHKRRFGMLAYPLTAARLAFQARPFAATILNGHDRIAVKTLQILVGNGRFYGGGAAIAAGAAADDGLLDVFSIEVEGRLGLLRLVPSLIRGTYHGQTGIRAFRATQLAIETATPRPVDLDGDILTQTPVAFSLRPAASTVFALSPGPSGE